MSRNGVRLPEIERFTPKYRVVSSGCWLWNAALDRDGYGAFKGAGRTGRMFRAHIWAYNHFIGAIPEGLQLDHTCRVKSCVNPAHLEPVTALINIRREREARQCVGD